MKFYTPLIVLLALTLVGCKPQNAVHILSVCIFEPIQPQKAASRAELIALNAYADARYNPEGRINSIGPKELEELGFKFRYSENTPLTAKNTGRSEQGIPSFPKPIQDVVIVETKLTSNENYELSVYVGDKEIPNLESQFSTTQLPNLGQGTITLSNGWIASYWVDPKNG